MIVVLGAVGGSVAAPCELLVVGDVAANCHVGDAALSQRLGDHTFFVYLGAVVLESFADAPPEPTRTLGHRRDQYTFGVAGLFILIDAY